MTSSNIALPSTGHTGQGTRVEVGRAQAQVLGAIEAAMRWPRDEDQAQAAMRRICAMPRVASQAFYRFPRGDDTVTGPSIHLARALAPCWRNVDYGVTELSQDALVRQSEILASATDLQTNVRSYRLAIVPWTIDTKNGIRQIRDQRGVYDNNANLGARWAREAILAILPPWFVEEAEEICRLTIGKAEGDKPLKGRVSDAISRFGTLGVTLEQLEEKLGRAATQWDPEDVTQLYVIYKSIKNGEISRREEFPPAASTSSVQLSPAAEPVTTGTEPPGDQPAGNMPANIPADDQPAAAPVDPTQDRTSDTRQAKIREMFGLLRDGGLGSRTEADRAARHRVVTRILELEPPLASFTDLTLAQVLAVNTALGGYKWTSVETLTAEIERLSAPWPDDTTTGDQDAGDSPQPAGDDAE